MRKRMVTRTIKVNAITSMVTNINTATVEKHLSIITGDYDNDTLIKLVKKELKDTPELVFACIINNDIEEKIYGMPEDEFLIYAKEITR